MITLTNEFITSAWYCKELESVDIKIEANCCGTTQDFSATFTYPEGLVECTHKVKLPETVDYVIAVQYKDFNKITSNLTPDQVNGAAWDSSTRELTFNSKVDYVVVKEGDNINLYPTYCDADDYVATSNGITMNGRLIELPNVAVKDGIYSITITGETATEIVTQKYCQFFDENVKCAIARIPDPIILVEAYTLYEALKLAEDCANDCDCENMCNVYNELITLLQCVDYVPKIITNSSNNCGCL